MGLTDLIPHFTDKYINGKKTFSPKILSFFLYMKCFCVYVSPIERLIVLVSPKIDPACPSFKCPKTRCCVVNACTHSCLLFFHSA